MNTYKNIFVLTFLLTIPMYIFGQLSVRNNAYVYVTDEVVFVTDDVNIEETTANIYLRNEAQLVQGSGATGNSGLGKLSVYQRGTVNEYAYNYWCSPVGNISANDNTNRALIPNQQFYDFVGSADPTLNPITSNLATYTSDTDGYSNPLIISNRWLYKYNPGTVYSEWDYVGENGTVEAGYGFTMKGTNGSGDNQLYDFRGKPNTGNIQTNILASQQTLVGNPYPSALDALSFIHDAVNSSVITGTLYYWEQAPGANSHILTDYIGGYAIYSISAAGVESFTPASFIAYTEDGTPIPSPTYGTGSKTAHRYIPIGQGFMVEGAAGIAPSNLTFKNSHRVYYKQSGAESYFFRGANNNTTTSSQNATQYNEFGNIVPDNFKRFRLNIDFNNTYTRQLLMNFHDSATDGFDYGLEGKSSGILDSDAYWTIGTVPYAIQALKFNTEVTIPLTLKSENEQPVNIRIVDIQNFNESQPIFIRDILTDEYTNLREQTFSVSLPTGTYTNRYEVTFTQGVVLDAENSIFENFTIYQNNSEKQLVIANPNNLNIKSVTLYDVLGKQIFRKTKLENNTNYTFSTQNLSDGMYIAKVEDSSSKIFTKKLLISNSQ